MLIPDWLTPRFEKLISRLTAGRLHHGLLLTGPVGIGKQVLAEALSKTILCKQRRPQGACGQCQACNLFAAGTHPDMAELTSDKQLGVDAIRQGIGRLNATAQLNGNKVLVIPRAEKMTEPAANALLKTLEEPTNNTFIVLLTARPQQLLPTIISRCEKHIFSVPAPAQALQWLTDQGINDASPALLHAYGGAPFALLESLEQEKSLEYRAFSEGIEALLAGNKDAVTLSSEWQEHAERIVGWLQQYAHSQCVQYPDKASMDLFEACTQARKTLQNPGVNKAMILSCLLAEIKQTR